MHVHVNVKQYTLLVIVSLVNSIYLFIYLVLTERNSHHTKA